MGKDLFGWPKYSTHHLLWFTIPKKMLFLPFLSGSPKIGETIQSLFLNIDRFQSSVKKKTNSCQQNINVVSLTAWMKSKLFALSQVHNLPCQIFNNNDKPIRRYADMSTFFGSLFSTGKKSISSQFKYHELETHLTLLWGN